MSLNEKYRAALTNMTDEQRARLLDALANPVVGPGRKPAQAAEPGTCDCSCAGCVRGRHCRHILLCGLGGPTAET
jgi:hypothetical protein